MDPRAIPGGRRSPDDASVLRAAAASAVPIPPQMPTPGPRGDVVIGPASATAGGVAVFGSSPTQIADSGIDAAALAADVAGAVADISTLTGLTGALQPLDTDLTDISGLAPSNDDFMQRKAGAWANRTVTQVKLDLGLAGTNTGDQTLAGLGGQPIDSDLTAIAALTPSNDDFLQCKAGSWANRTIAQVKIDLSLAGSNTGDQTLAGLGGQPLDSDLTAIAALASAANKFPYCTGVGTWALGDMPAAMLAWLTTPSSANLATLLTDEVGTGKVLFDTAPIFAAGSAAAASWPKMTAGTKMTAAEAGAIEFDGDAFYLSPKASNRGLVPVEYFIRQHAARNLTNSGSEQKLFDAVANGTLTLPTGIYELEGLVGITSMSGTSGNAAFDILGAGGATLAAVLYVAMGVDTGTITNVNTISGSLATAGQTTAASLVTAGTGATLWFYLKGTFEVSVAGTIIPSITLATAAAAVVSAGSYFSCKPKGALGTVSVGQWS